MANVVNAKKIKIKPENMTQAVGVVVKVKYAGTSQIGIGPLAKTAHLYKAFVQVDGIEKPLVLRLKEKEGWGAAVAADFKTMGKMFGKNKPVNDGDQLTIVYDSAKPKKAFLCEGTVLET